MADYEKMVTDALRQVEDPDLKTDIVSLGFVKDLKVEEKTVSLTLELTTPACPLADKIKADTEQAILSVLPDHSCRIELSSRVGRAGNQMISNLRNVKNIIAVASGKGGVGKSTVSVLLAEALARQSAKVGLLDADIYGPCIPRLLDIEEYPQVSGNSIYPVQKHGIEVMSMDFFLDGGQAAMWRGPMISKMLVQFVNSVLWPDLDYLIVDMPPGTGDIQLTLCQNTTLTGALIISTPQSYSYQVARRAALMFEHMNVPVLGLAENMGMLHCRSCGEENRLWDSANIRKDFETEFNAPLLGQLPFLPELHRRHENGHSLVFRDRALLEPFYLLSRKLASRISVLVQNRDTDRKSS